MSEVTFQSIRLGTINFEKTTFCNRNSDYQCPNTSVIEAVITDNHGNTSRVRCCRDQNCMNRAKVLALASIA